VWFLNEFAKWWKAIIGFVMSIRLTVCPSACNKSAATGRIFIKCDIWIFFENKSRKLKFLQNRRRITVPYLKTHDICACMIIPSWIFLRKRNVSDKSCGDNQTHILCSKRFFLRKSCLSWDNVEKPRSAGQAPDDNITRRMRFACWETKATDTHWEYAILTAFIRQQWLRERASTMRYTYIAFVVILWGPIYI
jgi:hypothetical protein